MQSSAWQVGVTGGIGAGKSTVCRIFTILGARVYDADDRAKHLMEESSKLRVKISAAFGGDSYLANGKLNRAYLAERVFNDSKQIKKLNSLVHPEVREDYRSWAQGSTQFPYMIREAALLIESGSYKDLDYLITVLAPMELRIRRVLMRDPQRTPSQVRSIISKQLTDEQRIAKSDYLLYNDGEQLLTPQVLNLHQRFIDLAN